MDIQSAFKKDFRAFRIIWWSMLASVLVYAFIVELLKIQHAPFKGFSPFPEMHLLKYALLAMSVLSIGIIAILRTILLRDLGNKPFGKALEKLKLAHLITWAICEAPAIYGLVLFLVGGFYEEFYMLLTLSLILLAIYRPQYTRWEELLADKG